MKSHRTPCQRTRLATRIVLIFLLLGAMTTATLSTFAQSLAPKNVPTCHGSESPPPSPKPVDHRCCAAGHQHALLTKAVTILSPATTLVFALRSPLTFAYGQGQPSAASVNPSPPPALPLRI